MTDWMEEYGFIHKNVSIVRTERESMQMVQSMSIIVNAEATCSGYG
jgi:hypothetical protein